jgi:hypothetical protein
LSADAGLVESAEGVRAVQRWEFLEVEWSDYGRTWELRFSHPQSGVLALIMMLGGEGGSSEHVIVVKVDSQRAKESLFSWQRLVGDLGWELVAAHNTGISFQSSYHETLLFKRPRDDSRDQSDKPGVSRG